MEATVAAAGQTTCLLVIENSSVLLGILYDELTRLGHGVDTAATGVEGMGQVSTLVRRSSVRTPIISLGTHRLNAAIREVCRQGQVIHLTPSEYSIREHLALNRGQVMSTDELLGALKDHKGYCGVNRVQVMLCNPQKKLGNPDEPPLIKTRRGCG